MAMIPHQGDTPETKSNCEVCYNAWQTLTGCGSSFSIRLGTFEEAMAFKCSAHASLLKVILERISVPYKNPRFNIADAQGPNDVSITLS